MGARHLRFIYFHVQEAQFRLTYTQLSCVLRQQARYLCLEVCVDDTEHAYVGVFMADLIC